MGKLADAERKGKRKWKNFGKDFPRGDEGMKNENQQRRREDAKWGLNHG